MELIKEAHQYNGFNLIAADISSKTMFYVSNRPKGEPSLMQEVSPGIHVLSNAKLDSPWHKVRTEHVIFLFKIEQTQLKRKNTYCQIGY